jgi:phosphoglycolate phosphatase
LQRTIIFDLDGTLVHSSPDIAAALNATLAQFGKQISLAETERMVGGGLHALLVKALSHVGLDLATSEQEMALEQFGARYRASPAALSSVHQWVAKVMIALHRDGNRISICSNKDEDLVRTILQKLDLTRWIHGIVGYRSGDKKKPAPEPLLRAIWSVSGSLQNAIMIGDSSADVGAARAAGIPVVLVPHGYGGRAASDLGADCIASSALELRAAIDALTNLSDARKA